MSSLVTVFAVGGGFFAGLDPAWIAFLGAAFGGVGLKMTEHWLSKGRVKIDDAAQIRDELRQEITAQREEIRALEAEVHKWREEYYALRDKHMTLQLEMLKKVEVIKNEVNSAAQGLPKKDVQEPLTGPEGA